MNCIFPGCKNQIDYGCPVCAEHLFWYMGKPTAADIQEFEVELLRQRIEKDKIGN